MTSTSVAEFAGPVGSAEPTGTEDAGGRARPRARRLSRLWARPLGKISVIVLAVAVIAAPALTVWWVMRDQAAAAAPQITSSTVTATVGTATFEKSVSGTGTLTPTVQDSVSFDAAGTVTAVDVAAGDTVTAGQVLATIDTLQLDAAAASAKATLATAQAQLASATADDDGSDAAQAQIESRQAAVDVAQSAYDDAQANLADATLTAPHAGLVTAVGVAVGDVVGSTSGAPSGSASGTSGTSGDTSTADFQIVGTDAWEVSVSVGESDVANVKAGNQVELTGDDLTDTVFGTVTSVALLPSTSSGAVSYPVTIAVTGSPEGLHDGVSVTATIIYERRSDVLSIPSAAVTTADDGTTTVDVVGDDGGVTATTVTLGDRSGQNVEVTDGLTEGQTLQYTQTSVTRQGGTSANSGQNGQFPGGFQMPDGFQVPDGAQMPQMSGRQMPGGGQ